MVGLVTVVWQFLLEVVAKDVFVDLDRKDSGAREKNGYEHRTALSTPHRCDRNIVSNVKADWLIHTGKLIWWNSAQRVPNAIK